MSIVQRERGALERVVLMIKSSEVTPRGRRSFGMICGALALLIAGVVLVGCDDNDDGYRPPSNVAVGESCWLTSHCAGDLICAGTIGSSVCSNRSVGSACASARHCASGLVCDTTTSDGDAASDLCEAPVSVVATTLGGSCLLTSQCASGLYCDTTIKDGDAASDTCKAQKVSGGICSSTEQCASGLQCIADIVGSTRCNGIALGGAVRIGSAVNFGVVMPAVEDEPLGLAAIGDTLYMVGETNATLYRLNSSSGVATRIGSATQFGVAEERPRGLAAIGSTLYMIGNAKNTLYRVNTTTGIATRVAPSITRFGITESDFSNIAPRSIAAVGNTLYLAASIATTAGDLVGRLYRFDTDDSSNLDGTVTRVGTSDNFGVAEDHPLGIAGIGTTLYMVGSDTNVLYTVDTTSGVATRVGSARAFGISGESTPSALATIGSTLYMLGAETDALYALRYQ